MIGKTSFEPPNYDAWEDLERLEEETGIEFTKGIDNIEISKIPDSGNSIYDEDTVVPARTEHSNYSPGNTTTLRLDPDHIQNFSQEERMNLLAHEGIHGLDFNGMLEQELVENNYVDQETFGQLRGLMDEGLEEMEGVVQKLANEITDENAGRIFRPRETAQVERYLEQEGIEIGSGVEQSYPEFSRNLHNQFIESDVYWETGQTSSGLEYSFVYKGGEVEKAEEFAKKYLEDLNDLMTEGFSELQQREDELFEYGEGFVYGMVIDYEKEVEENLDGSVSMNDVDNTLSPGEKQGSA